jgi:hypothetical protein
MLGDHPITPVLLAKEPAAARVCSSAVIIDPGKNALGILQLKH